MDKLKGLAEFLAVVDTASFSSAARKLGVSVAHVSRQVTELEERLGTKLFIRTTRCVSPTAAAEHLAGRSRPLWEELQRVHDSVVASNDSLEGTIRVSMAGHFAEHRVSYMLAEFCAAHPRLQLEIDMSNRKVDLLEGEFDFVVRAGAPEDSGTLVARHFMDAPMVTMASPALLRRIEAEHGAPLSPINLPATLCLSLSGRSWRFRRAEQTHVIQPAGAVSGNSSWALIGAAAVGLGLAQVRHYYLSEACRMHGLVPVFEDWTIENPIAFSIVYARNRFMPLRVRLLIEHLLQAISKEGGASFGPGA
jgi:DNA-binding transcriptional LysR family regulator